MHKVITVLSSLFLLGGCATNKVESYTLVEGNIIGYRSIIPDGVSRYIDSSRLFLYVKDTEAIHLVVLQNESDSKPLYEIEEYLSQNIGEPVVLYGELVKGQWNEFYSGIHMEVRAINIQNPITKKGMLIDVQYGDRLSDATRQLIKDLPGEGTRILRKAIR